VPAFRIDELRRQIGQGEVDSWEGIHASYDEMAAAYPLDRAHHAWEVYRYLERDPGAPRGNTKDAAKSNALGNSHSVEHPLKNLDCFKKELETLVTIRRFVAEQVYLSRAKDFTDPFRGITYRNKAEMEQVLGTPDNISFISHIREKTKNTEEGVRKLSARLGI
jgi:predicted phage-related endonuclease